MELKDYVKIIGKRLWLLIAVTLVVTIGAYIFTLMLPVSYDGSVSFFITKEPEKSSQNNYNYDKYYAIQASGFMADSIITWLQDPSNVMEIYNNANLNLPTEKINSLTKAIDATKKSPATININMSGADEASVKKLMDTTIKFVDSKNKSENTNSTSGNFDLNYSNPTVVKHQNSPLTNAVIGFVAGIILSLMIIFLAEYFSPKSKVQNQ